MVKLMNSVSGTQISALRKCELRVVQSTCTATVILCVETQADSQKSDWFDAE